MTAQAAQKNEAAGKVEVTYRGLSLTVDGDSRKDLDVLEQFEKGNYVTAVRLVLGKDQWAAFRSLDPKPNLDDVGDLFEMIGMALTGAPAGE